MDEQHSLSEEAGVQRFCLKTDTVATEEQSAADHVHGAADHRRSRGVGGPFAIVGKLADVREYE